MARINKILKSIIKLLKPVCFRIFPPLKNIKYYRDTFGRTPNLVNPKTFNEKILHKIIFDRNPKLTLFADKFLVRDFVKSKLGGDEHLTSLYAVVDGPDEICNLNLPNQFVMKPNHLSAQIKIVRDFKSLETGELVKLATIWLQKNHYNYRNEWAYKNIKPCIIFEELLEFDDRIPDDWKFFCFGGEPRFIQINRGRFIKLRINFYDLNLSLLSVRFVKYENFQEVVMAPQDFDTMKEIAKKLSAGTDFIRVDLYNIKGRIIFGELTNYPNAGVLQFSPSFWDDKFGSHWK